MIELKISGTHEGDEEIVATKNLSNGTWSIDVKGTLNRDTGKFEIMESSLVELSKSMLDLVANSAQHSTV